MRRADMSITHPSVLRVVLGSVFVVSAFLKLASRQSATFHESFAWHMAGGSAGALIGLALIELLAGVAICIDAATHYLAWGALATVSAAAVGFVIWKQSHSGT